MAMDASASGAWQLKADNLRRAFAHYRARETRLSSLPVQAIVELTQNCNYKCFMCAQAWEPQYQKFDPRLNMPMPLFERAAAELFPTAIMVDLHGFGESTILPHWPDVVASLERFPFVEWNLVTNLSLPRADVWDRMMKLGFRIGFSCDGASTETFEYIRTGGNFARTLDNLAVVRDAIARHRSGTIYFLSTIQRRAVHELRALVELAHAYAVPEVHFKIVQGGRDVNLEDELRGLGDLEMSRYVDAAVDAALDLGVRVTFADRVFTRRLDPEKYERVARERVRASPFWDAPGAGAAAELRADLQATYRVAINKSCFKPFSFVSIDYRGEIGPCNQMIPNPPVLGDLERQPLAEIWNNDRFQTFRREIVEARPSDERCQWCFQHRVQD